VPTPRKRATAHRTTGNAVRHPAESRSRVTAPAAIQTRVSIRTTVSAPTHVAPPPTAGSGGGPSRSSTGGGAVTGAGSVGTGSTSLARSGGGSHHTKPSTPSHPSGGTGTVSGGDG
jgi:hypothetical protein